MGTKQKEIPTQKKTQLAEFSELYHKMWDSLLILSHLGFDTKDIYGCTLTVKDRHWLAISMKAQGNEFCAISGPIPGQCHDSCMAIWHNFVEVAFEMEKPPGIERVDSKKVEIFREALKAKGFEIPAEAESRVNAKGGSA